MEGVVVAHRKTALNDAREALLLERGVEKLGEPSIDWIKRQQNAIIVPSVATPREPPSTKKEGRDSGQKASRERRQSLRQSLLKLDK